MPKAITVELYEYDELTPKAQERARDWYREGDREMFSEYAGRNVIEDAVRLFEIMGFTFRTHEVPLHGGGKRRDPCVWWQLGYMQSDGVWIEADYAYAPGAHRKIRREAPADGKQNDRLHAIADRLLALQKAYGYKLTATVRDSDRGPMDLTVDLDSDVNEFDGQTVYPAFREIIRDIERWIYDQLRIEDEYQSSDATVAENIRANEYTFRASGERFDG